MWRDSVPNSLFGGYNPFAEEVAGDWLVEPEAPLHKHLGDIYLNGLSFYEVGRRDEVTDPPLRTEVVDHWTGVSDRVRNPEQTPACVARRGRRGYDYHLGQLPGRRPKCGARGDQRTPGSVLPRRAPRGLHHRARLRARARRDPWAPPTAEQPGLIGPNWAKGWVIEDNVIHDAKCSAISLGKEASTGQNFSTRRGDKPGYQYQLESVFAARQIGWDREHVGSHVVRRNTIFDCGQNGIVGHLGGIFSTIEDNHIYNIALKREFYGYEIAGIKLHAAIDVEIRTTASTTARSAPGSTGRPRAPV